MGADEGARCQQLPSLASPHPSLEAEQACRLPTPLWRAELLHAVKTGFPPQSQGFPSSCRSLGWTKTDISHCPRDLVTWTGAVFPVPCFGDTINPYKGIYAGITSILPVKTLLLPTPRAASWMLTCQPPCLFFSRCFSTPGQMLPQSHLREDLFWEPTHHPLPTNFTLNKAHSLVFLLGSELPGSFEKTELRKVNGDA